MFPHAAIPAPSRATICQRDVWAFVRGDRTRAALNAYRLTNDQRLMDAAVETAEALIRGQLESGGWDNRIEFDPSDRRNYAYLTKDYQLTYSDDDVPTHYGFKVGSKLNAIERQYERLIEQPPEISTSEADGAPSKPRRTEALTRRASELVASLDDRGAWVEDGRLRYHGDDDTTRRIIDSRSFIRNLSDLARYVAATEPDAGLAR